MSFPWVNKISIEAFILNWQANDYTIKANSNIATKLFSRKISVCLFS